MYVWEHGVTAGIGNERYAITREKSGRGGSDKVHTKGRDLDPWTTLPTVEYRRIICVVRYEEKLPSIKEPRTEDLLSRFFFFFDPVGIRTRGWQLRGIGACFFRKQETASKIERIARHIGVHRSRRYQALAETWAYPSKRYNCREGHAVHSVPRMQISSSILRKRRSKSENSGGRDSYRPE